MVNFIDLKYMLPSLLFVAALLIAPQATAQDPTAFAEARGLIREERLDEAEALLREQLDTRDLDPSDRAIAMNLLVEAMAKAPYPDFEVLVPLAREAVAYCEENLGPDDRELARSFRLLGVALDRAGEDEEALTWFERAVTHLERIDGPESVTLCAALNSVGAVYMSMYEHGRAAEVFTRIIGICDANEDAGGADIALYLVNRAKCYRILGDVASAEADYRRAVREKEAEAEEDPAGLAHRLIQLVSFLLESNQSVEAVGPAERALEISRELYPENHPKLLEAERHLGWAYRRVARFDEARVHLERAVAIGRVLVAEDPEILSKSLESLASLEDDLGNVEAAIALQEEAIELAVAAHGPDHDAVSVASSYFAQFLAKAGYFAESRDYFERCARIDAITFGPTHPYVGNDILNRAVVDFYAGDYASAEQGFAEAEEIYAAVYPEDHPQRAVLHYNYGVLLTQQGRLEESLARFEIAAPSLAGALGPESPDLAEILNDYGKTLFEAGDIEGARAQLAQSLAIREAAFGEAHGATAASLGALANVEASLGNLEEAQVLAQRAVAMSESTRGEAHPWTARAMQDLARIEVMLGLDDSALELALRAERAGREHLRLLAQGSSERQALAYAASRPAGLDLAITAGVRMQGPEVARRVWDQLIRSRAVVLDEMAARHWESSLDGDERSRDIAEQLRRARVRLAGLAVRGAGELDAATYATLLSEATAEKESLERELASVDRGERLRRQNSDTGWKELQTSLLEGEVLVAYRRFLPPDADARYAAFVVRGGSTAPVLIDLGRAQEIERSVSDWRTAILEPGVEAGPLAGPAEEAYRAAASRLRELAWDPVEAELRSANRIFVVPDGAMNLVNLASLPRDEGGYLLDADRVLHLLSTERDLARFRTGNDAVGRGSGGDLLAVGGVDFDAAPGGRGNDLALAAGGPVFRGTRSTCGEFDALEFVPLQQSGPEVEAVAGRWTERQGASSAHLLTGGAASEDRFKALAGRCRVIHAATHGFFLTGACPDPGEASGWRIDFASEASRRAPENPLLQSGLAMAGANQRQERPLDVEDGILTAEEIAALDLTATDWVVLSACDTGLGHLAAGEGILGLRRGFEIAGARTLITSLWPVDDAAAAQWMEYLYSAHLGEGRGAADAANSASRSMLEAREAGGLSTHPFYWAPFVASGDWR